MARVDGGSGDAAAQAAAEAQRRAEEEARLKAEEAAKAAAEAAKKAAEVARKAAEAAAKQAADANKKAADATKALDAQKRMQAANPAQDPKTAKVQQDQLNKLVKASEAAHLDAQKASATASKASGDALKADNTARHAMQAANDAFKAAGKPPPYQNAARYEVNADSTFGRRQDDFAKLNTAQTNPGAADFYRHADHDFDQLANQPATDAAMQKLGIVDSSSFRAFANRLAREAQGGAPRAGDVPLDAARNGADPKALAQVISAAGNQLSGDAQKLVSDPNFASAVAGGQSPRQAQDNIQAAQKLTSDSKVAEGLKKLGLTTDDVIKAGKDALPELQKAAEAAVGGKWGEAAKYLEAAGKKGAIDIAKSAIEGLAKQHLSGPAQSILSDPKVVDQLFKAAPGTLEKVVNGDLGGAVKGLVNDKALRDAIVDGAMKDPGFAKGMRDLGLTARDLKEAGDALPTLIDAATQAAKGDFKGAALSLADAAKTAPGLVAAGIRAAASHLPDGVAKAILTDKAATEELAKAGPDALKKALSGNPLDAVKQFTNNKKLRDALVDAAMKDPGFAANVKKLGLDAADLKQAGDALPSVLDAVQKAASGDWKGAALSLADAAKNAPDVVAKGIQAAASHLPDGVAKTILTDKNVAAQLAKAGPDAVKKALTESPMAAVKQFAGNKELRDAVVDAAMKDKGFADKVAKLGLNAADLKEAGDALPSVIDAVEKAAQGDWKGAITSLADAAGKAPSVVEKGLKAIGGKLPDGLAKTILTDDNAVKQLAKATPDFVKTALNDPEAALRDFAGNKDLRDSLIDAAMKDKGFADKVAKLGLDGKDLKELGDGLPKVFDAIDAVKAGDWKGAAKDLVDAAAQAPDVLQKGIQALASHLPDGLAKTILTDPNVAKQLAKAGPAAIKALLDGNLDKALEGVAKDKGLRDAFVDAAMKDPGFAATVKTLGFDAADLKKAGAALPSLVKAGEALAKKPPDAKAALNALADAMGTASDVVAKGLRNAASNLPDGLAKTILTDPAVTKNLAKATPDTIRALADGRYADALGSIAGNKDLRDAVIDAAFKDKGFADMMGKVGLNAADLKQGADALPDVFKAAQVLADTSKPLADRATEALGHLKDAVAKAPDLAQKMVQGIGKLLPKDSLASQLLTDPKVSKDLLSDPKLQGAIGDMLHGKVLDGLSGILGNDSARSDILNVVGNNAEIKGALAKVGLTPADLQQAGAAAPHIINAMKDAFAGPDHWQDAISEFKAAGEAAPDLLKKVGTAIYNHLPDGVKANLGKLGITEQQVREGAAALPSLIDAGEKLAKGDWKGAVNSILEAGEKAPTLAQGALKKLGDALPPQLGLAKSLLQDANVTKALASDPQLHEALGQLLDGKVLDGVSTLLHDDAARDAVLSVVAKDPTVQKALQKFGLDGNDLLEAGAAAPHIFDAIQKLPGDWQGALSELGQAASAAPDLLQKVGSAIVDHLPKSITDKLKSLNLTTDDLKEAGAALPDVVKSIQDFVGGDPTQALKDLGSALGQAPDLVTKLINGLASHLPDGGAVSGLAKAILTDPQTVKDLLTNPDLKDAASKLLSGDVVGALKEAASAFAQSGQTGENPLVRDIANDVMKDKPLADKLAQIGITSADDIVKLGSAVGDAFKLVDDVSNHQWGDALHDVGILAKDIPEGLRNKLIGGIADTLHLPPAFKNVLEGSIDALANPDIANKFGDLLSAFSSKNVKDIASKFAALGEAIGKEDPKLVEGVLDSLKYLPGSIGKFFDNPELNKIIADSGCIGDAFSALGKLVNGDPVGAMEDLGKAIGDFLTHGDKIELKVNMPWPAPDIHKTLPVSMEGLKGMGLLFEQFAKCMPGKVGEFLAEKSAEALAKLGTHSVPFIGPVVGAVEAGYDVIKDITDHKGGIDIALDAADLVVNAAGLIPGASEITGPLSAVIAVGKSINDVREMIQGMGDFGSQMLGLAA